MLDAGFKVVRKLVVYDLQVGGILKQKMVWGLWGVLEVSSVPLQFFVQNVVQDVNTTALQVMLEKEVPVGFLLRPSKQLKLVGLDDEAGFLPIERVLFDFGRVWHDGRMDKLNVQALVDFV